MLSDHCTGCDATQTRMCPCSACRTYPCHVRRRSGYAHRRGLAQSCPRLCEGTSTTGRAASTRSDRNKARRAHINQGPSLVTTKPSKTRAVDGRVSQRRPRNKNIYASSERLVSKSSFSGEGLRPPIRVEAGKWTGEEGKKGKDVKRSKFNRCQNSF